MTHSMKLEETIDGITISVHVTADSGEHAAEYVAQEVFDLYSEAIHYMRENGRIKRN